MTQAGLLADGIAEMGLSIAEEKQWQLIEYLALMQKWNKVYNLTAVRDPMDMVILHLLDSLSILPFIGNGPLLDVGSGAGLPGIVMAIVRPELPVTTLDAVQKKTIFMRQVKGELGLQNLQVVHGRVETYQPIESYAQIVSRAFSDLQQFMDLTRHLLASGGQWLAMKGAIPTIEMAKLDPASIQIQPLHVAHLDAERHLIIVENHS